MENTSKEIRDQKSLSQTVAAGGPGAPTIVNFWSYIVPARSKFKITDFSNYTDTPAAWGAIIWRFKVNGLGARPPFNEIKDQYGLAAEPRPIIPIEASGGDQVDVVIENEFPGAIKIGLTFNFSLGG